MQVNVLLNNLSKLCDVHFFKLTSLLINENKNGANLILGFTYFSIHKNNVSCFLQLRFYRSCWVCKYFFYTRLVIGKWVACRKNMSSKIFVTVISKEGFVGPRSPTDLLVWQQQNHKMCVFAGHASNMVEILSCLVLLLNVKYPWLSLYEVLYICMYTHPVHAIALDC